jgi:hypothetical protein
MTKTIAIIKLYKLLEVLSGQSKSAIRILPYKPCQRAKMWLLGFVHE